MFSFLPRNIEITEQMKDTYIRELSTHGRENLAAQRAGMGLKRAKALAEADPEFLERCMEAINSYADRVVLHAQDLIFNGQTKRMYDRNGNIISEEKTYPIALITNELKKVDPESYRERKSVDVSVSGGVMIAPPEVSSIDDWQERFGNYRPPIMEAPIIDKNADDAETS